MKNNKVFNDVTVVAHPAGVFLVGFSNPDMKMFGLTPEVAIQVANALMHFAAISKSMRENKNGQPDDEDPERAILQIQAEIGHERRMLKILTPHVGPSRLADRPIIRSKN